MFLLLPGWKERGGGAASFFLVILFKQEEASSPQQNIYHHRPTTAAAATQKVCYARHKHPIPQDPREQWLCIYLLFIFIRGPQERIERGDEGGGGSSILKGVEFYADFTVIAFLNLGMGRVMDAFGTSVGRCAFVVVGNILLTIGVWGMGGCSLERKMSWFIRNIYLTFISSFGHDLQQKLRTNKFSFSLKVFFYIFI